MSNVYVTHDESFDAEDYLSPVEFIFIKMLQNKASFKSMKEALQQEEKSIMFAQFELFKVTFAKHTVNGKDKWCLMNPIIVEDE